jgi:hypothetical protein
MDALTLIVALSAVLWYCIDRFKPLWENLSWGRYITMAVAAVGAFGLVFSFNLDLVAALNLIADTTLAGKILTGLVLMSGSSAMSEIIAKIKNNQ